MSVGLDPGAVFGGYRIESLVGRGGMGLVYRATDLSLERPVALKLIAPELARDERFRGRFLDEPRLAASLDHPNVIPIYDAGECEGRLYLAMRYVEGSDLRNVLERDGRLAPERVLAVLGQIAGALDAAHRRGLVHRDVKPANVLLDTDGHVYLTDFGISKRLGSGGTDTGQVLGTLDYTAPEQIRGESVDARIDCYALGCVLYECLAGVPPFRRETEAQTLWAHMHEEPPPLRDHPALDPVLQRALDKNRDERYASCAELIEAATRALGGSAPAVPTERSADTSRSVFVGREAELAELVAGLDDAFAGRGRLFLVSGEPGIGKSRVADELIARARARGAHILVGRCWEAGGAPAYWPWVQALRAYIREADTAALLAQLGAGAADLAQIVPELRERFPDLPEPLALDSEGARFRFFEATSAFLRSAAEERPLVLVLDDLHAADEPSLLLLRFVAREISASRLLALCAFRDIDPALRDPLSVALAELVREPHSVQIALEGLTESDVAEYVELASGIEPAPQLVHALHAETEGNPLFVAEVVQLLVAEGRIADPDVHLRIPPGVRVVIGQRVGRLSERCRELLVAASVLGREFGLDALATFCGLSSDELLDALDEAMTERVVGDSPGSPGRLRFGHALIRDTLYDELTPARRLQHHQRAGEALEAVYSADPDPHLAELAHHFFAAAPAGEAEKAVDYASRAGDRAASQLAYEEAARLYEMALTLVGAHDAARCELLLALGEAQARAGDTPALRKSFRAAADLAEDLGLDELLARAALGYGGRVIWEASRGDVDHVPLLEQALSALGEEDSELRVRLLARLAAGPLRDATFPPERGSSLSEEALDMARRIGDPGALAYALTAYIAANHSPEFSPRQGPLATELLQVATKAGDLERATEGYEHRATAMIELGDMRGAKAALVAMAELADELRQPSQRWLVLTYTALTALLEGEFSKAEAVIPRARTIGERAHSWNAPVAHGLQLYLLRREQGRLEEVEELVERSVHSYSTYWIWRCVHAQTAAELGHTDEARDALQAVAADDFARLPFDEEWLVSLGLLAEAATALADHELAADIYRRLLPYGDRVAISYTEISIGPVARYLGLLAAAMERWSEAERHFEGALEVSARIGARPWLAHAQEDYARMLLRRGSAEDERARELLTEAGATYRELGMETRAQALSLDGPSTADPPPRSATS